MISFKSVSNKSLVTLCSIGVVLLFGLGYGCTALGYRGDCVAAEAGLKAQQEQVKNNYDNMWKRFREVTQVPSRYAGDLKKVFDSAMQGRYGKDGTRSVFTWIQEHNPTIDVSMYTKIQNVVEAGRVSFMAEQEQLLDKKRQYETLLQGNRAVFVGRLFEFPKIELDKIQILTSDQTEEVFGSKRAGEVKLSQ
jgi:hypothetical protein